EQCPLRSPSASNRSALGARLRWRAPSAADVPPRRNAGRHCAKESSHLATLLRAALPPPTLWPRREVIAEAHEFRRRMSQFQSPAFVIAFFATSLMAGVSFAADWPLMGPQLYPSVPVMPVNWTGIYFGANAGYGWAQGSSNTVFGGGAANTLL